MADGRRIGQFPNHVVGDQRLPLRGIGNKSLNVSLQEVRRDGHRKSPFGRLLSADNVGDHRREPLRFVMFSRGWKTTGWKFAVASWKIAGQLTHQEGKEVKGFWYQSIGLAPSLWGSVEGKC